MIFIRLVVSHTRNRINAVMTQDVPFERGMVEAEGEVCEIFDLGVVDDHAWADRSGAPCSPHRHILDRLEDAGIAARDLLERRVSPALHVEGLHALAEVIGVRAIADAPCTLATLRARLRSKGPGGIPVKVRAWLANILPPETVAELGIGRGIPIAARKAAEALRVKRDPSCGSRMFILERQAQAQADAHSAKRLKHRHRAAKPKET